MEQRFCLRPVMKGLTNVREIAERNSGFCNITAEKDSFTADVYIPLLTERGKSL